MDLEMEIFDIATCPKYDALSYTWGTDNDATNCDTLLNGWPITIRENLFDALHAIFARERQQSKSSGTPEQSARLYYWIDALCINQESVPERNQQVQLMGLIYSQASLVRVWLGDECMQALKVSKYEQKSKAYLIEPFFEAKYWTRLWTIQEFELAQDVVFMAGDAVVMLTEWLGILNEIGIAPDDMELQDRGLEGGGSRLYSVQFEIMERMRHRGELRGSPLKDLIIRFRRMECYDCRDTVYGLLGLAQQEQASKLEADYGLSPAQLCQRLERLNIRSWRLAAVLRDAAKADGAEVLLDAAAGEHGLQHDRETSSAVVIQEETRENQSGDGSGTSLLTTSEAKLTFAEELALLLDTESI
jgi:hypothetical protein